VLAIIALAKITLGLASARDEILSCKLKSVHELSAGKFGNSVLENHCRESAAEIAANKYPNRDFQNNKAEAATNATAETDGANVSEDSTRKQQRTSHTLLKAEMRKRAAIVTLLVRDRAPSLSSIPILDTNYS
jgi:hypothetical protein